MTGSFGLYVLSIAGAVVIMTVADIIIPEGQTSRYIKSALSIFLVLIIISPVSKMISDGINFADFFSNDSVQADYSFINKLNQKKAEALEENTEKYLKGKGYMNVKINILYTGSAEGISIDFVHADLTNLVFNGESKHINIIDNIIEHISGFLEITKEKVYIYGAD